MHKDDFSYSLPTELIAQFPSRVRGTSRLLCLDAADGHVVDRHFEEFSGLLCSGDLLVFNDTRVLPARMFGHKPTGGRVEIMVERILDDRRLLARLHCSKSPKSGSRILLGNDIELEVTGSTGEMFTLAVLGNHAALSVVGDLGHMPLPPYIRREDTEIDRERYQTVYARQPGAVAAPTAGLHFTKKMLHTIAGRGIRTEFLTLHIGAGTFQPLRTATIEEHRMHNEQLYISGELCAAVEATRKKGGRVIAVGTTTARGLETAGQTGAMQPFAGETDIFIYPGFDFKIVDALLTNFHLPESTLLMLVCAFAGRDCVMRAYEHAIAQKYRFYSYGDAMFITR